MNLNIYDLSRFEIEDAVKRLHIICNTYNRMKLDKYLDKENETLKKELEEAIPLLKKDIISRINNL